MKKIGLLIFTTLLLITFGVFEFFAGSRWSFVASRDSFVYPHVDAPINTLPVVAKIVRGETVTVDQCFFDKDDAYLLVERRDGSVGYTFDIRQPYTRTWRFAVFIGSGANFWRAVTCWRLAGQFGN